MRAGVGQRGGELPTFPQPRLRVPMLSPLVRSLFDTATSPQCSRGGGDRLTQRWPGREEGFVGDTEDDVAALSDACAGWQQRRYGWTVPPGWVTA